MTAEKTTARSFLGGAPLLTTSIPQGDENAGAGLVLIDGHTSYARPSARLRRQIETGDPGQSKPRSGRESDRGHAAQEPFSLWGWDGTIVGVVKDFHFRSLREEVKPLLLFVLPDYFNRIPVKIPPLHGSTSAVLERIGEVCLDIPPGRLTTLAVASITVSFQSVRAARANPVRSPRRE
jgi:hypothetical protein